MPGTNLTRVEAEARSSILSVDSYAVELDLTTSETTFATTSTIHFTTPAYATSTTTDASTLAAGTVLAVVALPWEGNAYERYLGILQNTGTTAISAGKINAFLTKTPAKWKAYDSPSQA